MGSLKIGGQREGILWSTKYRTVRLAASIIFSSSANPKVPPSHHEGRGGTKSRKIFQNLELSIFYFCNIYMNVDHVEHVIKARKQVFKRPLCTKEWDSGHFNCL